MPRKVPLILTLNRLQAANWAIITELKKLGFYDEYTARTEVYLVPSSRAHAYQYYFGDGSICIPRISRSTLIDRYNGEVTSLKDILRHEYGHAVACTHRGLMRSRKFSEAFGGPHNWNFEWEHDPDFHVTEYAALATGEDFAEVFYKYLKHKGVLPKKYQKPGIRRKWKFIEQLRSAIKRGKRRW